MLNFLFKNGETILVGFYTLIEHLSECIGHYVKGMTNRDTELYFILDIYSIAVSPFLLVLGVRRLLIWSIVMFSLSSLLFSFYISDF